MENIHLIKTENENFYLIDMKNRISQLIHPSCAKAITNKDHVSSDVDDFYEKKIMYWKKHNIFVDDIWKKSLYIIDESYVRNCFISSPQIVFEVTDKCNLKCKYCGYGELYCNYDDRETKDLDFNNAKIFIDYYISECKLSNFYRDTISVGFYGGEPLMNFKLIKYIIEYIELNFPAGCKFRYNITTNGILLNTYIDYLVEKKVNLFISLDGDEYASSYRVDKSNYPVFNKVIENIETIKSKYYDYFLEYVNFSSVLHDRNDYMSVHDFFKLNYGKEPNIGNLNSNGINIEKRDLYISMLNKSSSENYDVFCTEEDFLISPSLITHAKFIFNNLASSYFDYLSLFSNIEDDSIIPTSTCAPFGKKIYVTVNGKILPCEKIGHNFTLGKITNKGVEIDYQNIANVYNDLYCDIFDKSCSACYLVDTCEKCLFCLTNNSCVSCGKNVFKDYLKSEIVYFETHRVLYNKIKSITFVK